MCYADYDYYQTKYLGEWVPQGAFGRLAREASRILDELTFGRISPAYARQECVQMACCAMVDVLHKAREDQRRVLREKLDGYEVAYEPGEGKALGRQLLEAARTYLWQTGLLSLAVAYG